ncbi:MAG: hypothetical protein JRN38_06845, partial [Nitrososphaerota archaeon]|nr:hypothetical protein [Nitrososphaerota archaeon]
SASLRRSSPKKATVLATLSIVRVLLRNWYWERYRKAAHEMVQISRNGTSEGRRDAFANAPRTGSRSA